MADFKTPQLDINEPMILALPALFEPHKFIEHGQVREDSVASYGASFLIRPDQQELLQRIYGTITALAQQHFPQAVTADAQGKAVLPHRSMFSTPLKNGDEYFRADPGKKYRVPMQGHWVLSASAPSITKSGGERKPPPLSIVENGKVVDLPFDESRKQYRKWFYGGVQVWARIGFGARKSGAGITAYLNLLVSLGTGTAIPDLGSSEEYTGASGSQVFGAHVGTVRPTGTPYAQPTPPPGFGVRL